MRSLHLASKFQGNESMHPVMTPTRLQFSNNDDVSCIIPNTSTMPLLTEAVPHGDTTSSTPNSGRSYHTVTSLLDVQIHDINTQLSNTSCSKHSATKQCRCRKINDRRAYKKTELGGIKYPAKEPHDAHYISSQVPEIWERMQERLAHGISYATQYQAYFCSTMFAPSNKQVVVWDAVIILLRSC